MLSWRELDAYQERHNALLREAEQERLVQIALKGRSHAAHPHHRALHWLGQHLIAWGTRLQARDGQHHPEFRLQSEPAGRACD